MTEKKSSVPDRYRSSFRDGIRLFLFFARIGCFTFGGGWSILAQMEQEFIDRQHLITKDDLLELTAVGKSIPGIMITNISVLFGYQVAGIWGAFCATVGIITPAVIILTIVTFTYDQLKGNYWFNALMKGISCAVVPIIGSASISLGKQVFQLKSGILICLLAFPLCYFTSISNLILILGGALLALLWMSLDSVFSKDQPKKNQGGVS